MIRTRDFLLFVVAFVFILSGIVFTVVGDLKKEYVTTAETAPLTTIEGSEVPADMSPAEMDRAHNLAMLREKILRGEGEIIEGAPIFTSVDTPTSSPEGEIELFEGAPLQTAQYCATRTYNATALLWGQARAEMEVVEGARLVMLTKQTKVSQGSTTVATTTTRTVLQLPLRPVPAPSPQCLDSEYVGVAVDGSLINNDEVWRYRSYAAESVIGYARDGFPIYGPGVDETRLDACGGYDDGSGYRYHVRQNDMFVLGCYAGTPAAFID